MAALSALSEWLQLMLAEITRKREELESARAEAERREREYVVGTPDAAHRESDKG